MGTIICRHKDWFFLWSTNSDSLASEAMRIDELREMLREEALAQHEHELELRLKRVMERGTSSQLDSSAEDTCIEHVWDDEVEHDEDYEPPVRPFIDILREAGIPEEDLC